MLSWPADGWKLPPDMAEQLEYDPFRLLNRKDGERYGRYAYKRDEILT
jgi:hypothetical protein